jgi:riboflavin biosynthesis pyrimidine reductase
MRALLPDTVPDVDVHAHYAAKWVDRGGLRVNFVSSVDGAVSAAGTSRGLQTPGDNRVFAALRDLADVVLVGSGTATAENYGPARFTEARAALRQAHGLPDTMPIAVLSRSLRLDPGGRLFAEAGPDTRPIVLTCEAAGGNRDALRAVAEVIDCGADDVEPELARATLEARGLRRILCEGGPTVLARFADAGVVDELCLSVTPLLAGPGPGRITAGDAWLRPVEVELDGLLAEDDALFCRYRVEARATC